MTQVCEIYIKVDSDSANDLLDFIDENIDNINESFMIEFHVIDKENIDSVRN